MFDVRFIDDVNNDVCDVCVCVCACDICDARADPAPCIFLKVDDLCEAHDAQNTGLRILRVVEPVCPDHIVKTMGCDVWGVPVNQV